MTKILEAVAIAALLLMIAMTAVHWNQLPERYPIHFNAAGLPNKWGTKDGTLILPVIATALFFFLTVASRKARQFNIPFRVDQQAPEVRSEMRQLITGLKAAVMMIFAYIHARGMAVATGRAEGLGRAFVPLIFGVPLFFVAIYILRLRRFRIR